MIKTIKDLKKPTADLLNINEIEVGTVLDLYWKEASKKIENFENIEIYLYGLGTYKAKRRKIYDLIKYYQVRKERVQNNVRLKPTTRDIIIADCDNQIQKLIALRIKYESKDESRKQFKQTRSIEVDGSFSEQESDLGRIEKQSD